MPESEYMPTAQISDVDPAFAMVADLIFGGGVDVREAYDVITKSMPDQAAVHVPGAGGKKRRRKPQAQYTGMTVEKSGGASGAVGSTPEARKRERRIAVTGIGATTVATAGGAHAVQMTAKEIMARRNATKAAKVVGAAVKAPKGKLIGMGAAAGLGWGALHATELGADGLSYRANVRAYKANREPVAKAFSDAIAPILLARREGQITRETAVEMIAKAADELEEISKYTVPGILRGAKSILTTRSAFAVAPTKRLRALPRQVNLATNPVARVNQRKAVASQQLVDASAGKKYALRATAVGVGGTAGVVGYKQGKKKGRNQMAGAIGKSADLVDYTFTGEISKTDTHKRLAFGWCHLSEVDGAPHYDLQGDYAPIEEIEKSAYAYVHESRKGGDMHSRDGEGPLHTADLVESMVVTPEKLAKMGLSAEVAKSVPTGWWIGMRVNDDKQWAQVLSGERAGFSIHGKGSRVSKTLVGS